MAKIGKSELVSVIVPFFNREKTAQRCIDSIRQQTYQNLQVILVNDGSSDGTLKILIKNKNKDARISVISQVNKGASGARNAGLNVAKGEYILFVDSDDFVSKNYVEDLLLPIENESDLDMTVSAIRGFYPKGVVDFAYSFPERGRIRENFEFLRNIPTHAGKLYRSEIINRMNLRFPEDMSFSEDRVFNLNYYKNIDSFLYVPLAIYCVTRDVPGLSLNVDECAFSDSLKYISELKKFAYENSIPFDSIKYDIFSQFCCANVFGNYREFKKRIEIYRREIEFSNIHSISLKEKCHVFFMKYRFYRVLYCYRMLAHMWRRFFWGY